MTPKTKQQLAREHFERARPAVAADDYPEAVTWLFASLEAAVAAIATQHGIKLPSKHWRKAEIAEELHSDHGVAHDFAPALRALNDARKQAIYEGEEPEFDDESLEDISATVETAVELAEKGSV